jgi:hypothetical protein
MHEDHPDSDKYLPPDILEFIKHMESSTANRISDSFSGGLDLATITMYLTSVAASVATVAQLTLAIIESHKKGKNQPGKSAKAITPPNEKVLDEVKDIVVIMDDGNHVSFDAWQTDPNHLKKFFELYQPVTPSANNTSNLPPISPRPIGVDFRLSNGSTLPVRVSYNDKGELNKKEQLDRLITYLKEASKKDPGKPTP